jgi:hypothetical protein
VLGEKQNLRGFEIAATGNFHKYVGVKVAYSLGLREDNFSRPAGSGTVDTTVQTFLGGLQFKDNRDDGSRFRPFGHTLFGVANQKVDIDSPNMSAVFGLNDYSVNESSFAMAFGGGVDIKLNKRISIRAVQADWLIINRGDQQVGTTTRPIGSIPAGTNIVLPGTRQDNFRLGAGIVIH